MTEQDERSVDPRMIEGLRRLLADLGDLPPEVFANSIGTRGETVRRWLRGQVSPQDRWLRAIERVYGVTSDQLRGLAPMTVRKPDATTFAPDADMIARVVEDLELDDDLAERLRATAWTGGLPSEATLRSYAIDLRGQRKGKLKAPPSIKPEVREGGRRVPR